ncbi:MAG TPA: Na/Pi cotransporter family protein [Fulvivirga sp.]|nr:Na/Pi cotransporter family protein [Fulvivirga sp.]
MDFGIFDLVRIIGALGFFIFGMKVMSESLQLVAGSGMRKVLGTMTTNRYTGVLTGFLITAILQSSSATTVMTVSFVNAGLVSLVESAGVMMGANIGTTVTGWLVSLIGFKIKISSYALPIIAVGFPLLFSSKERNKKWGEVLIGFALLFMGLGELKDAVPDVRNNPEVLSFLHEFSNPGLLTRIMFVGVGTLLTVIVQSSSAAMTLTIVLTTQGLPLEIAAAMVLGENIGTTITAELASVVANVHAKRSARIHSMFNIIGVTWMVIVMPWFLDGLQWVLALFFSSTDTSSNFALAAFHTAFNLINVLLLIGFVPQLVALSTRTVKSRGDDDEEFKLEYISRGVVSSSEIALGEVSKEMAKFAGFIQKMSGWLFELSNEKKDKRINKLLKKIEKTEAITDELEEEINGFMVKITSAGLSLKSSIEIRGILSISSDLERVADIILRMSKDIERQHNKKVTFSDHQIEQLNTLASMVDEAIEIMIDNLSKPSKLVTLDAAFAKELEINKFRSKLRKQDLKSVENENYDIKAGIVFRDLFNGYEKIGDHVINVTEAVLGLGIKDDDEMRIEA